MILQARTFYNLTYSNETQYPAHLYDRKGTRISLDFGLCPRTEIHRKYILRARELSHATRAHFLSTWLSR